MRAILLGFNPLRSGALVSSCWRRTRSGSGKRQVSIPFVAGHWFPRDVQRALARGDGKFQSPS